MSLGKNVLYLRQQRKISHAAVAEAVGTTAQNISQMEKRDSVRSQYTSALAKFFDVDQDLLVADLGDDEMGALVNKNHNHSLIEDAAKHPATNLLPGPDINGGVPLISWVRAGSWDDANDPFHPGDADDWLPYPRKGGSGRVYALRVRGDSMYNPAGPKSYPDGSIIFVDPDRKSPVNGERVIAKLEGSPEVTFKVFMSDAGRSWLRALNPNYPPIETKFKILGTVVGKWEDE